MAQIILRIRFRGPDMDFVKAIAFDRHELISSVLGKIDRVRVAAGWSEDKPQSAFGLVRIPERSGGDGDVEGGVLWLDASNDDVPLSSLPLRERALLEYRELTRSLRVIRRDGLENCKVDVSERDTVGDILRSILRTVPSSIVQVETSPSLRGVIRLDKVFVSRECSFLVPISLHFANVFIDVGSVPSIGDFLVCLVSELHVCVCGFRVSLRVYVLVSFTRRDGICRSSRCRWRRRSR
jgi:hypothetical protein